MSGKMTNGSRPFWTSRVVILSGSAAALLAIVAALAFKGSPSPVPSASAAPAPSPSPSGQAPAILPGATMGVSLQAEPNGYNGPCPVTVAFSGMVTLARGSGPITYRFVRSDGASGSTQILSFDSPGSQPVRTTWSLGAAGSMFSGWQAVETLSPISLRSGNATFSITCQ